MAIHVKAYITESGEIRADLPKDHPVGEMMRTDIWRIHQGILRQYQSQEELAEAEVPLTDDEIQEMMKPSPKKLGKIVTELETSPRLFSPLIGFDDASQFSVSPDQIIASMMRTSIWDVYPNIVKDCHDDLQT
jgi:hypothetical protein